MRLYKDEKDYEVIKFSHDDDVFDDIKQGDYIKYGNLYFKVFFKLKDGNDKYLVVNHPVTVYDYR